MTLHLAIADDEELAELERALLRARAAELGDVRRRNVRLTAGYGDDTTREVLDDEGRRAQIRYDVSVACSSAEERTLTLAGRSLEPVLVLVVALAGEVAYRRRRRSMTGR